jgi:hypothetical protein
MAEDLIRYDVLAQEALRGLVRKVLTEVAQTGLPGEHHFFITFDTRHPGVRISTRIRAQYPSEMTVVMQHQFWDLTVTESAFEVGLSFKGVPEKLFIPFRAITGFVDPHASFGLKFDPPPETALIAAASSPEVPALPIEDKRKAKPTDAAKPEPAGPVAAEAGTADVVSLDAFRKKNG